jgi:hypothetical protein
MPYARRNALGQIESLHAQPTADASERVSADSDEVRRFLGLQGGGDNYEALDKDFVRVLEDLIEILMAKGVVAAGELPVAAQAKLLARKEHRESRQRGMGASGYATTGFVTVIDDSAFGQLADLDLPPRDRGPRSV